MGRCSHKYTPNESQHVQTTSHLHCTGLVRNQAHLPLLDLALHQQGSKVNREMPHSQQHAIEKSLPQLRRSACILEYHVEPEATLSQFQASIHLQYLVLVVDII